MNKQELIKHFEDLPYVSVSQMGKKAFIDMIEQLDEPDKPVVKQFEADWYEDCKDNLEYNIWSYIYNWEQKEKSEFKKWLDIGRNNPIQTLINMHQFGYTVEEEKRYLVKMKGIEGHNSYLKYNKNLKHWYFGSLFIYNNDVDTRTYHTRKELEEAGLSDVFNSQLFEIEEVKDDSKV